MEALYHDSDTEQSLSEWGAVTRKRTEIRVETDEVLVVRRTRIYRGWCRECGVEVEMIPVLDAWTIVGRSGHEDEDTRSRKWHVHGESDTALVCMKSLVKSL